MITLYWCPRTRASRNFWLLGEYAERCLARPAYVRALARDVETGV